MGGKKKYSASVHLKYLELRKWTVSHVWCSHCRGRGKKRSCRVGALLFLASVVINYSALQPYSKTSEKAAVNDTKYDTEETEGEVWLCVCADVRFPT